VHIQNVLAVGVGMSIMRNTKTLFSVLCLPIALTNCKFLGGYKVFC